MPLDARSTGAGKLDTGAAIASGLSVTPASLSFGKIQTGSVTASKQIQITNTGTLPVNLALSVSAANSTTVLRLDRQNLSLAAGASGTVVASLSASAPTAGAFGGKRRCARRGRNAPDSLSVSCTQWCSSQSHPVDRNRFRWNSWRRHCRRHHLVQAGRLCRTSYRWRTCQLHGAKWQLISTDGSINRQLRRRSGGTYSWIPAGTLYVYRRRRNAQGHFLGVCACTAGHFERRYCGWRDL